MSPYCLLLSSSCPKTKESKNKQDIPLAQAEWPEYELTQTWLLASRVLSGQEPQSFMLTHLIFLLQQDYQSHYAQA